MSAGIYNIDLEQGSDYGLDITYKDGSGAVFDLTSSYSARMDIRDSPTSSGSHISLTNSNGRLILHTSSSATPNIKINLSSGETAALDFDTAFYDLEISSGGSTAEKVIRGRVKLIKEYTK